jgi:hypothetical protein
MNPIWLNAVRASGGLWYRAGGSPQPVAAYQPIGAASLAASYVNLANPGVNDAAPGVAPTWASGTGWTGDGLTTRLDSGVVATTTTTMIVRVSGVTWDARRSPAGDISAGTGRFFDMRSDGISGDYYGLVGSETLTMTLNGDGHGVMAICGDGRSFWNGSPGTTGAAMIGNASLPIALLCRRVGAATYNQYINYSIQAVAIYSTSLTASQVSAVSAAMAAL